MYGDLQFTNGTYKFKGSGKVFKFKAHPKLCDHDFIVGFSGTAEEMLSVKYYFENPDDMRPPRTKGLYGLILTANGNIYRFADYTKWLEVREPFAATGSGMEYAIGAMALGASPKEAVKVAMKHDAFTGMGIKGAVV